eukprot:440497_1
MAGTFVPSETMDDFAARRHGAMSEELAQWLHTELQVLVAVESSVQDSAIPSFFSQIKVLGEDQQQQQQQQQQQPQQVGFAPAATAAIPAAAVRPPPPAARKSPPRSFSGELSVQDPLGKGTGGVRPLPP